MKITKIYLENFRNFKGKRFSFSEGVNVIIGPNTSGKTNILESIYLLSTGKSFRARVEEEMINYKKDIARVEGEVVDGNEKTKDRLKVVLTRGEIKLGDGEGAKKQRAPRKRLFLNGVPRRLFTFSGNLKVVVFSPWDLDLVTESPSIRRRFLDQVISQVDREYRRSSLSYEKGVRQRNKLLLRIRDEGVAESQLLFWNKLLIKNGNYLNQKRQQFIDFVNQTNQPSDTKYFIYYDESIISESRLSQYSKEEIASATTLVGPHRDDFIFKTINSNGQKKRDLAGFGSRGEQRMGVLWIKLAELSFIKEKTKEKPVLLLDDIFSELDHEHRKLVLKITKKQQTIITTADPHYIQGKKKVEKILL